MNEDLQRRVAQLVEEHGQAVISRKTGYSATNIHNYVNGTRVPAEFCMALTRELGVNPVWLLTGEGGTQLSDVTRSTSELAGNFLELVNAINAVTRVRLGALAGKQDKKTLHQLNAALKDYEARRGELNARMKDIFRTLLDQFEHALAKINRETASQLLPGLEQAAGLCDNTAMQERYRLLCARHAIIRSDTPQASKLLRDVLRRRASDGSIPDHDILAAAAGGLMAVSAIGKNREARRMCRSLIELCAGEDDANAAPLTKIRFLDSVFTMREGNVAEAIGRMAYLHMRLSPDDQFLHRHTVHEALVYAGLQSVDDVIAADATDFSRIKRATAAEEARFVRGKQLYIIYGLVSWFEDARLLRRALGVYQPFEAARGEAGSAYVGEYVRALTDALEGKKGASVAFAGHSSVAQSLRDEDGLRAFSVRVCLCHLLRIEENTRRALAVFSDAENVRKSLGADVSPNTMICAQHWRNARKLFLSRQSREGTEAVANAGNFFQRHWDGGFAIFKDMIPDM
ncbi:MAG: hypothetical protein HUU29_06370 [Planctomycetaceae bacterium]|nr:hypothetical protein [Planctomycetaceae bacterium]